MRLLEDLGVTRRDRMARSGTLLYKQGVAYPNALKVEPPFRGAGKGENTEREISSPVSLLCTRYNQNHEEDAGECREVGIRKAS